jgi:hypothetical protein
MRPITDPSLIVGGREVQRDVFERRAVQLEVGQRVVALERPPRKREHQRDGVLAADADLAGAVDPGRPEPGRKLGERDPFRHREADLGGHQVTRAEGAGRALGDDQSARDHRKPIGQPLGLFHVVGGGLRLTS